MTILYDTRINTAALDIEQEETLSLEALSRDLRRAAGSLTVDEARFLVDAYYLWQKQRIRTANQQRALDEAGEPHAIISWLYRNTQRVERMIQPALSEYTNASPLGRWVRSIIGIGPVISAGLLAHINIEKAPTAGHIWRFAGQDPTITWERKTRRPWNAELKMLCWKMGESFVKQQNHTDDVYGHVYAERKEWEKANNEAGRYADRAAEALEQQRFGKDTEAYKWYSAGKLPPAHIHARAKRYAVKIFLAHYHHVAYELRYGVPPPKPYIIEHGGHTDYLAPPNWPMSEPR